jgi:hypothetical protein
MVRVIIYPYIQAITYKWERRRIISCAVLPGKYISAVIPHPLSPSLPMIFAFKALVIKAPSREIGSVLSFECGTIMGIVIVIAVMSVPGGVRVIGIPRVIPFV